jgi:hypothetical protein
MSKSVVKGRPKGTTKSTFIKDPLLEPYHIVVDENSFNLIQTNKETQKEKVLGYFTVLGAACEKAAKLQLLQDKSYSLMEFKNEYSNKLENLKKALIYGDN